MTRLLAACCAVALATSAGAQIPADVTARRVPFRLPVIGLPLTPYSLQRGMADVAWAAGVPIGYEAPADESSEPMPSESVIKTDGLTLEELFGAIVTREPRYLWSVDDGVIHLRPKAAAADPGNVLNQNIGAFVMDDTTLHSALHEVHFTLDPSARQGGIVGSGPGPSALGLRRFSVNVGPTTVQGVLDAIVKAHGSSSWSVTYSTDSGRSRPYRITFRTFDGWARTW